MEQRFSISFSTSGTTIILEFYNPEDAMDKNLILAMERFFKRRLSRYRPYLYQIESTAIGLRFDYGLPNTALQNAKCDELMEIELDIVTNEMGEFITNIMELDWSSKKVIGHISIGYKFYTRGKGAYG